MDRIDYRPWVCAPLFALVLAYVGCTAGSTDSGPPEAAKKKPAAEPPSSASVPKPASESRSKPDDLLDSLGKPAAVLVISGEQNGYMEPCGCSEEQEGGLIRRYDLVERLHKRNWPTVLVDLGTLLNNPNEARGGFDQAKIKFDFAIKALKLLNYNALALSADDLRVGVGEALGLFDNGLGDTTKIVTANVQPAAVFERIFRPSLVVTAGPVKLGITAVIDPESLKQLSDPDKEALLPSIKSPESVLPGVLADLESKSDYQVLLVQAKPEVAKQLALANPGFDVVVATSQFDDILNREAEMLNGDKTTLVTVGKKGKHVGLIGLYPHDSPRDRFLLVTLNKQFSNPAGPMKALIQDEYRDMLKATGVVANYLRRSTLSGATFVGAETCKQCHPNTFEFWSETKHADAFVALKKDPKPNTIYDAECVTCHTTGFEYNSGWRSQEATPYLAGNQCENCHGPGSKHVSAPDNDEFKKAIAVNAGQANTNGFCYRCHDAENSLHFEFAKYWDKIVHNELDDYKDPKVHQPVVPKPTSAGSSK
jgi:Cytochrome c554 and c-prime